MILILQNIRSLYNVGSIFRTADAAGVTKIYLCGITPTPLDKFNKLRLQLTKVSLGAEKTVSWEKVASATRLIDRLKKDKYKIFAVEQDKKSVPYYSVKPASYNSDKTAIVLGNEVRGLSPAILKRADKILEIPMRGALINEANHPRQVGKGKESLNVGVSFGIVAFGLLYINR